MADTHTHRDVPTRIYLTGFMGSGKSTIGPRLARRLGYAFLDLDADIEARAGCSIPTIFAEHGEAAFRAHEAEALRATETRARHVVALGGGALTRAANLAWTLAHGTVVYLSVDRAELARRLDQSRTVRPLLLGEDGTRISFDDLCARIAALLDAREPFYHRAHLVIDTTDFAVEESVEATLAALRGMSI